jgi:hypothetical protein
MAFAAVFLAAWASLPAQAGAASAGASPASETRRAILVRGAYAVKGLPFFPPNALPALTGTYGPDAGSASSAFRAGEISVWYTRETLVLGGTWKRADIGGSEAYFVERHQGPVVVLKSAGYYLFFELPAGTSPDDKDRASFVRAFDRKFLVFFANAATDAELSFPAYVDY